MRRSTLVLVVATAAACGKLDKVDFTRSASVTVPGSAVGGPSVTLPVGSVDLGGKAALQQEGIDPNAIDAAHLKTIRLDVKAGDSLETWLDDVVLTARADGLPDVVVAEKHGIRALPANTRTLDLDVTGGVDLKPYLTGTSPTLAIQATGSPPRTDTTVDVTATVQVDVSVKGLFQ